MRHNTSQPPICLRRRGVECICDNKPQIAKAMQELTVGDQLPHLSDAKLIRASMDVDLTTWSTVVGNCNNPTNSG